MINVTDFMMRLKKPQFSALKNCETKIDSNQFIGLLKSAWISLGQVFINNLNSFI